MTLNGRYALYCSKHASFGAHHENLDDDRPVLAAAEMYSAMIFFLFTVLAGICEGSLERGRQATAVLSTTAIFK